MVPAAPPPDQSFDALLRRWIHHEGPLAFSAYMDAALYDERHGFYATGGAAGRAGDFLTAPEVGPLFGAVLARALDTWWDEIGRPDPFVVLEGGAGPGTLARSLHRAGPRCAEALVHVLVERAAAQRRRHGEHLEVYAGEPSSADLAELVTTPRRGKGPVTVSASTLPPARVTGVVVANELLDNLPFDIVRATAAGGVEELRVGVSADRLLEPVVAAVHRHEVDASIASALDGIRPGVWVPHQRAAAAWVGAARRALVRGRVVVLDYATTDRQLDDDDQLGWLRTYARHGRGVHPLDHPGRQDITADVAVDQLRRACPGAALSAQADWLGHHGIGELVEEGRRTWAERAHLGDLHAIRARSRVGEAEALLDPAGLGGFAVLEWAVGGP